MSSIINKKIKLFFRGRYVRQNSSNPFNPDPRGGAGRDSVDDAGQYGVYMVGEMMTDDDFAMMRACFQAGLVCLGVGGLWVIVSVVREWWRGRR